MNDSGKWESVARFSQIAHDIRDAPAFSGARAKINRAKHHWPEIEKIITDHLNSDWYTIETFKEDGIPTVKVVVFSPGFDLSVAIGDFVHNLRSALDHMAVSCVELNSQSPKDVYFPFAPEVSKLEGFIRKAKFHRAPADAIDLLRSYKPYRGGNAALRAIHDLDVADKHRALVPAVATTRMTGNVDPRKPFELQDFHVAPPKLVFHPQGPLGDKEILPTLKSLLELTAGIVDAFEMRLISGGPR